MTNEHTIDTAAQIVIAYVSHNPVAASDLPGLITAVHGAVASLGTATVAPAAIQEPAIAVRKSVQPDCIICLEDGRKFKSLKRHLRTQFNLTPEQYREKWNLPADYPMVAPTYSAKRSQLAKDNGLGRKPPLKVAA